MSTGARRFEWRTLSPTDSPLSVAAWFGLCEAGSILRYRRDRSSLGAVARIEFMSRNEVLELAKAFGLWAALFIALSLGVGAVHEAVSRDL